MRLQQLGALAFVVTLAACGKRATQSIVKDEPLAAGQNATIDQDTQTDPVEHVLAAIDGLEESGSPDEALAREADRIGTAFTGEQQPLAPSEDDTETLALQDGGLSAAVDELLRPLIAEAQSGLGGESQEPAKSTSDETSEVPVEDETSEGLALQSYPARPATPAPAPAPAPSSNATADQAVRRIVEAMQTCLRKRGVLETSGLTASNVAQNAKCTCGAWGKRFGRTFAVSASKTCRDVEQSYCSVWSTRGGGCGVFEKGAGWTTPSIAAVARADGDAAGKCIATSDSLLRANATLLQQGTSSRQCGSDLVVEDGQGLKLYRFTAQGTKTEIDPF